MTAPGNSALVFTLLAVFLACSGYAAGRLHQRYQMERDREEAYRDGYDTATRSIFSMAARLVAPRRGGRPGSRPVVDGSLVRSTASSPAPSQASSLGPSPAPEVTILPAAAISAAAALSDPALSDPAFSDPALSDPALSDPALSDPALSDPALFNPAHSGHAFSEPALSDPAGSGPGSASVDSPMFWPDLTTPEPSPGNGSTGSAGLLHRSAGASPVPSPRRAPAAPPNDAASLGFPVPPRPPSRIVGEPAAYGGVVYRPFPDPRLVGNAETLPADRGSYRVPGPASPRSGSQASASPPPAPQSVSPASLPDPASRRPDAEPTPDRLGAGPVSPGRLGAGPVSPGRHTVPDELVQAETYRLPPDRVYRAKVPDPADRPALPEESTTRLSVPKPRQS
ncbi:hypothetical protein ACIA5D_26010 [Actinoplanes sp. NPDC051513]|uniref:hypothetical protein n=1 Tax=Actinoplanes sp. NPDC051513 TaxID=3363908 RepID=UPI00379AD73F